MSQESTSPGTDNPRKRDHLEFMADCNNKNHDHHEYSNDTKRMTRSTGPLAPQERLAELVPQKIEPCWRCKALKLSCNGKSWCYNCVSVEVSDAWKHIGCRREDLQESLKDAFPNLPGSVSSEWFLPALDGIWLKIKMKYDDPKLEISDLDISGAPPGSLVAFLKQFHDINTRWGNWYEPVTVGIITQCAEVQKDIILKHRRSRKTLSEDSLLLALAFRTFALVHNIGEVCINLPSYSEEDFRKKGFLKPAEIQPQLGPLIEVSRCDIDAACSSIQEADFAKLGPMVTNIVQITQRLLVRQKPADWPVLFCSLCLLKQIQGQLSSGLDYLNTFPGEREFEEVWRSLCRLYAACTNGRHPLVDDWNREEFESLVGHDTMAVRHMNSLNDLWVDGGFEEDRVRESLAARIYRFVTGSNDPFLDDNSSEYGDGEEE